MRFLLGLCSFWALLPADFPRDWSVNEVPHAQANPLAAGEADRAAPAGTWTPLPVHWRTGTVDWRGQFGRREALLCPPGGHIEPVFGTDMYTDDSSVCTAALHAGILPSAEVGGIVAVEIRPDPMQYLGTSRNGITSEDWFDHWPSSFVFVPPDAPDSAAPAIVADARTSAESWPKSVGRVLTFLCPPRVEMLSVFGTNVYTDDSPICSAAVHAGRAAHHEGGLVTIVIRPGQRAYPGSSQHGVPSMTAESRLQSYEFIDTPPNTPRPPTLTTPFHRADGRWTRPVPID